MKHLRTIGNESGFTLIEAMMAGGILLIVLLGIAGSQAASFSRNAQSKDTTVVTNFGVEMFERIQSNRQRVLDYNNIDTTASTPCPQTTTAQRQALADCQQWRTTLTASNISSVRGTVTATRIDPDPTTGAASLNRTNVVITLSWNTSQGSGTLMQSKSMTFRTVIAPE
jgi:type IV pilus assembly protein PilV